jgi:4-diphosphocytidyl-2-C-methyl-D-erythritol kinase
MTPARIDHAVVRALAKINLCLHVGLRRPDGYHNLESLVVFADYGDELRFECAEGLSLSIDGPFAEALPVSDDNLVLQAARLLAERGRRAAHAHIRLTKRLPIASGIGGGSADAAATLRGLARLWRLDITLDELLEIAALLGADVPMCVASAPAWVAGRGERLSRFGKFPDFALVLVNPLIEVSTAEVFASLKQRTGIGCLPPPEELKDVHALVDYLRTTANDLERPAIEMAPVIAEMLSEMRRLPGVLLARMSGSGATCFGVFADHNQAQKAGSGLARSHPGWWIVSSGLSAGYSN